MVIRAAACLFVSVFLALFLFGRFPFPPSMQYLPPPTEAEIIDGLRRHYESMVRTLEAKHQDHPLADWPEVDRLLYLESKQALTGGSW